MSEPQLVNVGDPIELELTKGLKTQNLVALSYDARLERLNLVRKVKCHYEFRADEDSPIRVFSSCQLAFFTVADRGELEEIRNDIEEIQHLGDLAELFKSLGKYTCIYYYFSPAYCNDF